MIKIKKVNSNFAFDAHDDFGNIVKLDTKPDLGGENYGVRPMQLLLMGLGGCSGIDIVSILKKQRQTIDDFEMEIKGKRQENKNVSLWEKVEIIFHLKGDIDKEKAQKACDLSMQKHCSVAETLRLAGCEITYSVKIN